MMKVAPARGRGLKFITVEASSACSRRPRKGAWIEIGMGRTTRKWKPVAPARGRGLKFAHPRVTRICGEVAPARGRGLKFPGGASAGGGLESPPQGGVD